MTDPTKEEVIDALKERSTWNGYEVYGQALSVMYNRVGRATSFRCPTVPGMRRNIPNLGGLYEKSYKKILLLRHYAVIFWEENS